MTTPTNKQISVTYDIYDAYDDMPTRKLLGTMDAAELDNMLDAMRSVIGSDVPRCVRHMALEYSHAMHIYPTTDASEYNSLSISGVIHKKRVMCTSAKWPIDERNRPAYNCIRNLHRGKCKCPLMRTVAEIILPNLYVKTK